MQIFIKYFKKILSKNNYFSSFSISLASVRANEIIPDGMVIIPRPIIKIMNVKILPPIVIGTASPYPSVVKVTTDHQRLENMDENVSGCTAFSK